MDYTNLLKYAEIFITDSNITIPDIVFVLVFYVILLGKYELLKINYKNFFKAFFIVVPVLVTLVSLKLFANPNTNLLHLLQLLVIFLLTTIIYRIRSFKDIAKSFLYVAAGTSIVVSMQVLLIPLTLYGTGAVFQNLQNADFLALILAMPRWIILSFIIAFMLMKRSSFLQTGLLKLIIQSRTLRVISIVIAVLNLVYLHAFVELIYKNRILTLYPLKIQVAIAVAAFIFPILNIFTFLCAVYYLKDRDARERFNIQEEFKISISDIHFFLKRGQYYKIMDELKYLERGTEELYRDIV